MKIPEKHRAVAHAWVDGADIEGRLQPRAQSVIGTGIR